MDAAVAALVRAHRQVTRRYFLRRGSEGLAAWALLRSALAGEPSAVSATATRSPELVAAIGRLRYLTPQVDFTNVGRGDPVPSDLDDQQRREAGLAQETWSMEVVPDADTTAKVERPLSKSAGTALDWQGLMRLAQSRAVRYLKVMTCNNMNAPLGMGLWEGVPLRDVLELVGTLDNVRRVYYFGYHNDKPEQMFRSSLALNRVLEDPPGELPVLVCYKLNGEWLSPKRGGPVRMLVPEAYGFKSVKWLQRVVLTNDFKANDTYADANNDIESWQKSFARFVDAPEEIKPSTPIPLTGLAQVGMGGVAKVQVAVERADAEHADDPHFTQAPWRDAELLPLPEDWTAGADKAAAAGPLPLEFDSATGRPKQWPLRYTLVHWAALLSGVPEGKYQLRCRTIDLAGRAQPLPRPYLKSGRNAIHSVELVVSSDV